MKRIYIIHGWDGSSQKDWVPWTTKAFQEEGYSVVTPDMPHTEKPEIKEWVGYLRSVATRLDESTYFIGHSIGCQTIMRFLETVNIRVGGAIFVAGWFNLTNLESSEADSIAEPWIKTPIDYLKIKTNLPKSVVMLGDNDPWVPYEETKRDFEIRLGSEVVTLPGAAHITSDDGFGPFPQLIEIFKKSFE